MLADLQVTGILHVADNFLNGSFGDSDLERHIAQTCLAIAGKTDQHVAVVAEKGPFAHYLFLLQQLATGLAPVAFCVP